MAISTRLIFPALQCLTSVARRVVVLNLALLTMLCATQASEEVDVVALVTGSIDQTRGLSSYAEMSMLIKRPSWQRQSTLKAWTRGREDALDSFCCAHPRCRECSAQARRAYVDLYAEAEQKYPATRGHDVAKLGGFRFFL